MTSDATLKFHHDEHRQWMSQLDFYQDEILIFQKNLSLVIQSHPDLFSIIELVEEYRKILMKKLQKIDNLRHQISLHEHMLAEEGEKDLDLVWEHHEVREHLTELIDKLEKLKANLRHFISKYLR